MSKTQSLEILCESANSEADSNKIILVSIAGISDIDNILSAIDNDDMIQYIARNFNPEDIFSTSDLAKWAESEGYVKE